MTALLPLLFLLQSDPGSWSLREDLPPPERDELRARLAAWLSEGGEPDLQAEARSLTVASAEVHHAYRFVLEWTVELRRVERSRGPLTGEDPGPRTVQDPDPWSVAAPPGDPPPHGWRVEIPGGAQAIVCGDCAGKGRTPCSRCRRSGKVACSKCGGDGQTACSSCSGNGKVRCSTCGGDGKKGIGSSRRRCTSCSGTGKRDCTSCSTGQKPCGACSNGRVRCPGCHGELDVDCGTCRGSGRLVERLAVWIERRRPQTEVRAGGAQGTGDVIARFGEGEFEDLARRAGDASLRAAWDGLRRRPPPEGKLLERALVVWRASEIRAACRSSGGDWTAVARGRDVMAEPDPRQRWAGARAAEAETALGGGDLDHAEELTRRALAVAPGHGRAEEVAERARAERSALRAREARARAEADRRSAWISGLFIGSIAIVAAAFAISGIAYLALRNRAS